ncbi:uncharacterized protein [Coffea arabica]|uniref:Uncharacterized protein isoform X2 n=1 Tax=Coffea arabica TaxID=13443 RepID=A0ABM4X0S9_COFAR|nr:uncharacterized protein LOC113714066 isoform X2 [Coffea arabica]
MAEYVVVPLGVHLPVYRNGTNKQFLTLANAQPLLRRQYHSRSCKSIQFSSWNSSKLTCHFTNPKIHAVRESFMCFCLGALVNADFVSAPEWVPYVDQVLLMASIFLTYSAGVIPGGKPLSDARRSTSNDFTVPKNSSLSGSSMGNDNQDNLHFAWDLVAAKLLDSLYAREQAVNVSDRLSGINEDLALHRSSLRALAELPRIRCLWTCFNWLRKEVDHISGSSTVDLTMVMTRIFESSFQPLCLTWLEEELCLKNNSPNKALLSSMIERLKGYSSILKYIRKSGKEDLYAELISALSFGYNGMSGCYGPGFFTQHGVSVLEDLVITIAEGIASMYLELISVDGSMSTEMNSLGLNLCTLSTRALQRLRNEVALHQWLHQNMESVVSMYEDRFELRTFETQLVEECSQREAENLGWWKKLSLQRSRTTSPSLSFLIIMHTSISIKRTKELRALTGWQYYFSLFLELSDIATPLIRTLIGKVSDAISFFLVCLIGRSLGLIYSGIRQSLRWK